MLDLEIFEEVEIFIFEGLSFVVLFLILNVVIHSFDLGMAVGKCSVALLPVESAFDPVVFVDEIGRIVFDIPHEVG
jgi:hypothetical protein